MVSTIAKKEHICDLCVVGGGLAGTIAALSAARHGLTVVLMQDRPVLGGNASSEIRMWVRGANGMYNRETGILAELEEENIYRNPGLAPALFDSVLFGKVKAEKNITLLLNTSCLDAACDGNTILSVTGWQLTTYTYHTVKATYFADCSGDSILAPLVGARHRIGREGRAEYGESIAPETPDNKTMGMSVLLQARETDHKVPFIPPAWANVYESDDAFCATGHKAAYSLIRDHQIATDGTNLWWVELGGDTEAIRNTEEERDNLLKALLGIWDHIKNRGDHSADNWEIEWIGFLPGKRESVRYIGAHVLTQQDLERGGHFADQIAYGGWTLDDHNPAGLRARGDSAHPSQTYPCPSPYGIPFGSIHSANIRNLFFAGRNISATHAAMSSTRVMGTCSLLGQAVGTAAAVCRERGIMPGELGDGVKTVQQVLLDDGVFLPDVKREIPPLSREARLNLTDSERETLQNGVDRPRSDEEDNGIYLDVGQSLVFTFDAPRQISRLRMVFDRDFSRKTISVNNKSQKFAQILLRGKDFRPVKVPATLVKAFAVYADGEKIFETDNNYESLIRLPIDRTVKELRIAFTATNGAERVHLFACDVR